MKHHLLKYPYLHHYYLRDLNVKRFYPGVNDAVSSINDILTEYDFIGITEQLDESLLAFQNDSGTRDK